MSKQDLVRYQLLLPRGVADRLKALAAKPGFTKLSILAKAVTAFLDCRGASELDERFAARLDRMSGRLARIERGGHVGLESLALFVRYMLTVNAPLADEDEPSRSIGRDRFAAFVIRVGQQLASGRLTLLPERGR